MYTIFTDISAWTEANQKFALATVVRTWGSAPRAVGAKMAVNQHGEITGSVSGGCVEGAVAAVCDQVIKTGLPQLLHFDVEDRTAWEVGLACGGELDVFIQVPSSEYMDLIDQAENSAQILTTATLIKGTPELLGRSIYRKQDGQTIGTITPDLDTEVNKILQELPPQPKTISLSTGEIIFIDRISPPPTLIIIGGVHIAVSLTKIAKACDYQVIIVDPRRQFATKLRFPEADQIVNLWPDKAFNQIPITSNSALAFLTHDPKIDDPGLIAAFSSPAFYIGGLGSKNTQAARRQ
ncbi:MAG: XdhC family protein, partial [Anaerolineales bacterium]